MPNQGSDRQYVLIIEETDRHCGQYRGSVEGFGLILRSSRQPFLDAARELLKRGVDPQATLVMRRSTDGIDCLGGVIGSLAKLTVKESSGSPKFAFWSPYPISDTQDEEKRTSELAGAK